MSKVVVFLGALAIASAKSAQSPHGTNAGSPPQQVRARTEHMFFETRPVSGASPWLFLLQATLESSGGENYVHRWAGQPIPQTSSAFGQVSKDVRMQFSTKFEYCSCERSFDVRTMALFRCMFGFPASD